MLERIKNITIIVLTVMLFSVWQAYAGNPAGPGTPPASTSSYTLSDIYNRINTGATASQSTFTEPTSGPSTGTMHTLNEIYDLVGKRVFVLKTGQTTSHATGDDGDLERGLAWLTPRFTDNSNGTVTDNLTGLIWLKNGNCANANRNWTTALSDVAQLNTNGTMNGNNCGDTSNGGSHQTDWRLPNVREYLSLIDYGQFSPVLPSGHPFTDVRSTNYWSSTTSIAGSPYAFQVDMGDAYTTAANKTDGYYLWAVRGGQ